MAGVTKRTRGTQVMRNIQLVGGAVGEPDILLGRDGRSPVVAEEITFTETAGAGIYTGAVAIPAGATITNIRARNVVAWNPATSATLKIGDDDVADGFFTGVNLMITDLVVGEELNFDNLGGKPGSYLVAATGHRDAYRATAKTVSAVVTVVGATGTAGRTRVIVEYVLPMKVTAATKV